MIFKKLFLKSYKKNKNKRKILKRYIFLIIAFIFVLIPSILNSPSISVYGELNNQNEINSLINNLENELDKELSDEEKENLEDIEEELKDTVNDQLADLDLSALENFLNNLTDEQKEIFGSSSILDKLNKIISGEFSENSSSLLQAILNLIFDELLAILPFIASIIAIAVLAGLLSDFKGNSQSIRDIIHFVCYGVIIVIVASVATQMITLTSNTLSLIVTQMEIIFPLLLTLLTAMGGTVSVAVYQPAVVVLTSIVTKIFTTILMPIFIFALVFSIVSNLSNSVRLDKLSSFLNTLFKWIIGIVFTIFMGFLAIKGITAGSIDSISFKTAKFSLSTYVPILGGYLSEGLNVILASCVLIKNAIGASGLLLLFSTILIPLLQLVLFMLALKFTGALLEPLSDNRISNFISSISKIFIMPIVMIIGVAFMYVIFVGLIMCTSVGI